jgi:hypothetical protein
MGLVTANIHVKGVPLRRAFVEHTDPTGLTSLGWAITDSNGSFTFDAGLFSNSVDIKIHCQNSVVQVLNAPVLSADRHPRQRCQWWNGEGREHRP